MLRIDERSLVAKLKHLIINFSQQRNFKDLDIPLTKLSCVIFIPFKASLLDQSLLCKRTSFLSCCISVDFVLKNIMYDSDTSGVSKLIWYCSEVFSNRQLSFLFFYPITSSYIPQGPCETIPCSPCVYVLRMLIEFPHSLCFELSQGIHV